jgi:DNA invertase Pin-like site-specific DNA recombinase
MKSLAPEVVSRIVAMLKNGQPYSEIQRKAGTSKGAIAKIKKEHLSEYEGNAVGRPRILSKRDGRDIVRKITTGAADTAVDVAKMVSRDLGKSVSTNTVRRALKNSGLKSSVKVKKPLLRP